jgi:hypothetical protein
MCPPWSHTVAGKPEASKIVACSPIYPTTAIPHRLLGGKARYERHPRTTPKKQDAPRKGVPAPMPSTHTSLHDHLIFATMARRYASINDQPIAESERKFHWVRVT